MKYILTAFVLLSLSQQGFSYPCGTITCKDHCTGTNVTGYGNTCSMWLDPQEGCYHRAPVCVPRGRNAASEDLPLFAPERDEEWECESEIVGKTQELDNGFTYCSESGDWACYFEIEEVCEEVNSGRIRTSHYDQFRFCTRELSDCF